MNKIIDDKLTYKIIGCAMKVHNTLGNGFQEVIYQRCLAIELDKTGISYQCEKGCSEKNNPENPLIREILIQTIELAELESSIEKPGGSA